ncbi:unnamed protein product [Cochlearia groenlandica]
MSYLAILNRGQDLVIVYLKVAGEIQEMRLKNRFLERQAKKLKRRTKGFYRVLQEKNMRSISVEKDFLRCLDELEKKNNIVKELEVEVKDLKTNVDLLLQKEKEEVYNKFSNSEQAKNIKSEVISLRWSNACLRHMMMMMMRHETSYEETTLLSSPNENLQVDAMSLTLVDDEHHEENHHNHHHESSRRKRLMKKLKRWGRRKGQRKKTIFGCEA